VTLSDRYLEPDIETMPRPDLVALQEGRLLEMIAWAYDRSPLTRLTWETAGVKPADIKDLDDFRARAPFISKNAVRDFRDRYGDPYGGLLCVHPSELSSVTSTSGTTGDATFFAEQWDQWAPMAINIARDLWEAGLRPGARGFFAGATFRGPVYQGAQIIGATPVLGNHLPHEADIIVEMVRRHRPVTFYPMTSPLYVAFDHLSDKVDLREAFASVRTVVFSGEPRSARMKQRMSEWGMDVVVDYTSAGDAATSMECREGLGCHLPEDRLLAEHLDPSGTGPVAPDQLGELVVTSLDNRAAPLIRYRSEDLIRFSTDTCGCGRTHARQWPCGRAGDEVVVDGHSVSVSDLFPAVESVPETAEAVFQLVRPQREMDVLRVRVGYDPERGYDRGQLRDKVAAAIEARVGVPPDVDLVPEEDILSRSANKIRRVTKE
jgi:phenylacetate-CoA ligase